MLQEHTILVQRVTITQGLNEGDLLLSTSARLFNIQYPGHTLSVSLIGGDSSIILRSIILLHKMLVKVTTRGQCVLSTGGSSQSVHPPAFVLIYSLSLSLLLSVLTSQELGVACYHLLASQLRANKRQVFPLRGLHMCGLPSLCAP